MAKSTVTGSTRARSPDAAPRNGKKFLAAIQEALSEYSTSASAPDVWKWASKQMTGWVAEQKRASASTRTPRAAAGQQTTRATRSTPTKRARATATGRRAGASKPRNSNTAEPQASSASAEA